MFGAPGICLDPAQPLDMSHPLNRVLVSEWAVLPNGQWGRGTLLRDLNRGLCNDGTLTSSPTWEGPQGRPGGYGCLSFTAASSQYVDFGNVLDIGTTDITASVWIKVANGYAPSVAGIIGKTLQVSTQGRWAILWDTPTGKVYGLSHLGNSVETAGIAGVNDGNWHALDLVIDRNNNLMTLYVDGGKSSVASTIIGNPGTNYTISNNFRAGSYDNGSSAAANFLTGSLDAIQFCRRARSAAEVAALYAESLAGNPNCWRWVRPVYYNLGGTPPTTSALLLRRRRLMEVGAA